MMPGPQAPLARDVIKQKLETRALLAGRPSASARVSDELTAALRAAGGVTMANQLRATSEAKRLGREYEGDPERMARALNVPVAYLDLGGRLMGDWSSITDQVRINSRLGEPERERTLAHELGHRVLGHHKNTSAAEAEADLFMETFLAQRPPSPGEQWAQIQQEMYARVTRARAGRRFA